jgi:hypothetical protein
MELRRAMPDHQRVRILRFRNWTLIAFTIITSLGAGACAGVNSLGTQNPNSQSKIVLVPNAVDFKNVAVDQKNTQTIKITNQDVNRVQVKGIHVSGSAFAVTGSTFPFSLAPHMSSTFNVEFAPKSLGATTGTLTIESNLAGSETVSVKGVGSKSLPKLQTNLASINFGNLGVKGTATQKIVVTNSGNANLTVDQVVISGSGFSLSNSSHFELAPQQETTFLVFFKPQVKGTASGLLKFVSKELNTPLTVFLAGTAVDASQTPSHSAHTVALSWNASAGNVQGYYIYRGDGSGGPYTKLNGSIVSTLEYSDTNVESGHQYFYVVTSVNHGGHESVHSEQVSVTIPNP